MSSISSIASVVSPAITTAQSTAGTGTVSKDEFLRLLVTQLQKQDPLNPQDPSEFTSQLAQFSSLEQLISIGEGLDALTSQQALGTMNSAAGYIGRTVRVEGDVSQVAGGAASAMSFELGRDSARTTLEIYDASGNLVKVAELGAMTAGRRDYQWDAKKSDGSTIVDGTYRFKVTAEDANGDAIATQTSFSGTVTGVSFAQGQAMLTIGGQAYPLGSLISIGEV